MKVLVLSNDYELPTLKQFLSKFDADITYDPAEEYDRGVSFMHRNKITDLSKTWINFHPAPLPDYKGRNLCYHAIMNNETFFGASVHYVDENFDTGRIIDVYLFDIDPGDTAEDVSNKALHASYRLLDRYFLAFSMGVELHSTANVGGTYYKKKPIADCLEVDEFFKRQVRAITYGDYAPRINIGGVAYKIVRDE